MSTLLKKKAGCVFCLSVVCVVALRLIYIVPGLNVNYSRTLVEDGETVSSHMEADVKFSSHTEQEVVRLSKSRRTKPRILVSFGTRPEAIKMVPIILECKKHSETLETLVMSTGQHREMVAQVLREYDLADGSVNFDLDLMRKNQRLSSLSSNVLVGATALLKQLRPDAVLVQGDTTTAAFVAMAAFYQKIPIVHVEAGLRTHNIHSPFPEEANRQIIGNLASLHFPATSWARNNLIGESKNVSMVVVTGNPVVDALYMTVKKQHSETFKNIISWKGASRRMLLLTAHRRENHGPKLEQILKAACDILQKHDDIVMVFPVHMNPNVRVSLERTVPSSIFRRLQNLAYDSSGPFLNMTGLESSTQHFQRLLLLNPLDHVTLVQLMANSFFILTDSGGIQEEGVSVGTPVLILRDETERPEVVTEGAAILVGANPSKIFAEANKLLEDPAHHQAMSSNGKQVYGDGHAAEYILKELTNRLTNGWSSAPVVSHDPKRMPGGTTDDTFSRAPLPTTPSTKLLSDDLCDVIFILTVWKRSTLDKQMNMVARQTILKDYKVCVVIFQNGQHVDEEATIRGWQEELSSTKAFSLQYVRSTIETGYFGRFAMPLAATGAGTASFWAVFDDDVIFGSRYMENALRVVKEGFLSTRNGRMVNPDGQEVVGLNSAGWDQKLQVTWEEDIDWDFGGHIWVGRMQWLRLIWQHPPPSLMTSEDMWLSAVLKSQYNISTRSPRCRSKTTGGDVELCSCSMQAAETHEGGKAGDATAPDPGSVGRHRIMKLILDTYKLEPLNASVRERTHSRHKYTLVTDKENAFDTQGTVFEECLFWC